MGLLTHGTQLAVKSSAVDRFSALSCALVILWGCSEPRTTIIAAKGRLDVGAPSLDFGDVPLGIRQTGTLMLNNSGGDSVSLCLPRLLDEGCPISSHLDPSDQRFDWPLRDMRWLLRPSESLEFSVAFEPDRPGAFNAQLVIGHDGENGPELTIQLTGNGITPNIALSQTSFDFGQVPLGTYSTQTLTVENLTTPESTVTLNFAKVTTSTAFELRAGGVDLLAQGTLSVPPNA